MPADNKVKVESPILIIEFPTIPVPLFHINPSCVSLKSHLLFITSSSVSSYFISTSWILLYCSSDLWVVSVLYSTLLKGTEEGVITIWALSKILEVAASLLIIFTM